MSMSFGGGAMWGGGAGGGARPGAWGGAGNATQGGAPFAGVPPELQEAVNELIATEPDHGEPGAVFTQVPTDKRVLTLKRMIMDRWRIALFSLLFLTVESIGFQTGPLLTQIGIDYGLVGKEPHLDVVIACGVIYLVTVLLTVLVERARIRNTGRLAAQVMNDLRVRVYAHIQRLSLDYFTDEKAGVIMTRMTSDIEALQQLLQDGLVQFAIQGLTMIFVTAVLLYYNWKLALITVLIILPSLTVASLWFRSGSERAYLLVRDRLAGVIADVAESLSGVRVIASYNRQRNNVVHHRNVLGAYRDANFKTARVTANYSTASDFIGLMGQALLLFIGGTMVLNSWHSVPGGGLAQNANPELTIGQLTAFVLYLGSFFQPIQQLVQLYNTYQQGQAAVSKLRTLLGTEPSVAEKEGAYALPPIDGAIALEDVDFGYNERDLVLHDVNIAIGAGESVAFVGPTGAGKSTMAKLVTRFYDPTGGRVTIDGHDLRDVSLGSLRRQLGVVPQEPFLFTGTIRDNVAFAKPGASTAEVDEAIDAVGLTDLVDRLSNGLDTLVHERGQSLSSGERQLVALARAFVAGPRVLVLDEATSNLDLKSEAKVERALDRLLEGRTAILIAHRLTTAMRADRIIVVDNGRIVEAGSHSDLVAAQGRYAEMFETWSRQHDTGGHDPGGRDHGGHDPGGHDPSLVPQATSISLEPLLPVPPAE
jgi:ATP-binding cassette subfamily B protein